MFKKKLLSLTVILFFTGTLVLGQDFKVITYNIWNGFDWGKDSTRRLKYQEWVTGQVPDFVALQELCQYTPAKLQEDAKVWGHPYSVLLKTTGYSVGFTSRYPIEVKEKIMEGMHHGALHCVSNGIDFLVVHLHPGSYGRRREEAEILAKKILEIAKSNDKYVVLGDFNAHSPMDADLYNTDGEFLKRLRDSNTGKGPAGNIIDGGLDYSVISKFLGLPLYDVVQKFSHGIHERGSFPARSLETVNGESSAKLKSRMERIDYILVSENLSSQCTTAKVLNGSDTAYLSDHYPVTATFKK